MSQTSNDNEVSFFSEVEPNDFFENFDKYVEIRFSEASLAQVGALRPSIARNLRKEFESSEGSHSQHNIENSYTNRSAIAYGLNSEPLRKLQNSNKLKTSKTQTIHNFFCLCFVCQTRKFLHRKRSSSILTGESGTYRNGPNKENVENGRISNNLPSKKSFILKNGKPKPSLF